MPAGSQGTECGKRRSQRLDHHESIQQNGLLTQGGRSVCAGHMLTGASSALSGLAPSGRSQWVSWVTWSRTGQADDRRLIAQAAASARTGSSASASVQTLS